MKGYHGTMRHYLDLVTISGKVHRRQSRMTRICIVLAVVSGICTVWAWLICTFGG